METTLNVVGNNIVVRIHLDTTKVLDGAPDPAWLVEYSWGAQPNDGQTWQTHIDSCRRESVLLAEAELQRRQPPQGITLMGE